MTHRHANVIVLLLVALTATVAVGQQPAEAKTAPEGFKVEIEHERLPVLSQGRTGTCWSFATVSFLESELERINKKPVDLSEIYPVYFAYVEKAKRFMKHKGKSQFSEGGLSHDVIDAVKKYGLVPHDAYTGLCPGDRMHDHAEMASAISAVIEKLSKSKRVSKKWEAAVRGILDAYIGEVPTTVTVDGKEMTPVQYAMDHLKLPADDYIEVMSYKYAPFYAEAKLTVPDNWCHFDRYLNVPLETMMTALEHAVRQGYSIAVDVDVSEKGFNARKGLARLTDEQEEKGAITPELREEMFKDKRTTDDHLMHIVGLATDEDGRKWYMTKNSWGGRLGFGGNLYMSENYLRAKMLAFMVHKDGLPKDVRVKKQNP